MQLPLPHADPFLAMDVTNQHSNSILEPVVQPSAIAEDQPLALQPDPNELDVVLAPDSDSEHLLEYDVNDWLGSLPHPSQFVRPPPQQPVYYVVTIGEEAGIYDSTWAETFDIRRVSRLEQFSMQIFRDWDLAHQHYTDHYNLNRIPNTPSNSDRAPSLAPILQAPPAPDPTGVIHTRAQSAPAVIPTAAIRTDHSTHRRTPFRVARTSRHGSVESGTPGHPFYVASSWPTPVISQPTPPDVSQPIPPVVSQPVPSVVSQPVPPTQLHSRLPTIPEHQTRPRVLMTQLYFDRTGCLINPQANVVPSTVTAVSSTAISIPSSPEDDNPPPARQPRPFPLVVDPNFFTFPSPAPRGTPSHVELTPASQRPILSSVKSGDGVPETPFLNTPTRHSRPFVNLFPNDADSTVTKDKTRRRVCDSGSDSDAIEDWARILFKDDIERLRQASASPRKLVSPVASSSNGLKASTKQTPGVASSSKTSRKRRSPTTPTSKPNKSRKTPSKKSAKSRKDPTPDDGDNSDALYLPDP